MSHLFNKTINLETALVDAFGRQRVSQPLVLFDSQLQYDKAPNLWDEQVTGAGSSSTHLTNESAVRMRVGTTSGDIVIRQSRIYTRYQPGMSHLVLMTGVLGPRKANVRQRIGYFDTQNGIFFELSNGNLSIVKRTYTSGSVSDTVVGQSNWSIDKLDGTGKSKITIDTEKTQIMIFDFQWLGVGRVRVGFVIDGVIYYCHEFHHANNLTKVYMTTANLPCRFEIENLATTTSSTDLIQICSSVISEGGFKPRGYMRHAGTTTAKNINTTMVPIISVRPKSTYKDLWFEPLNYEMLNTANSYVYYQIVVGATLTGANWQNAPSTTFSEYDITATSYSGGTVIQGGYVNTKELTTSNISENLPIIGTNLDGTRDTLTIVMGTISGSATVLAGINWKEVR